MSKFYSCNICQTLNASITDLHNHYVQRHNSEKLSFTAIDLQDLNSEEVKRFKPGIINDDNNNENLSKHINMNIKQPKDHDETYCALYCSPYIAWEHELNKRKEVPNDDFIRITKEFCSDLNKNASKRKKKKSNANETPLTMKNNLAQTKKYKSTETFNQLPAKTCTVTSSETENLPYHIKDNNEIIKNTNESSQLPAHCEPENFYSNTTAYNETLKPIKEPNHLVEQTYAAIHCKAENFYSNTTFNNETLKPETDFNYHVGQAYTAVRCMTGNVCCNTKANDGILNATETFDNRPAQSWTTFMYENLYYDTTVNKENQQGFETFNQLPVQNYATTSSKPGTLCYNVIANNENIKTTETLNQVPAQINTNSSRAENYHAIGNNEILDTQTKTEPNTEDNNINVQNEIEPVQNILTYDSSSNTLSWLPVTSVNFNEVYFIAEEPTTSSRIS